MFFLNVENLLTTKKRTHLKLDYQSFSFLIG